MNTILAITCSTEYASVSCLHQGKVTTAENEQQVQHSEIILELVKQSLVDVDFHQIDCIAVDIGPGSFMGIRTAVATAQGIAFAHNIPVFSISSLHLLALSAMLKNTQANKKYILSALDARRQEWYFNSWKIQPNLEHSEKKLSQNNVAPIHSHLVASPEECLSLALEKKSLFSKSNEIIIAGNIWHESDFQNLITCETIHYPNASILTHIANENQNHWHHSNHLKPLYIRDEVAHPIKLTE